MARESLRVGLVCPTVDYGGAERHLLKLATAMTEAGVQTAVMVLDPHAANSLTPEFRAAGIDVLTPPASRNHPASLIWLARLLRSGRFDVVHSFLWRADVTLALAARVAGFGRVVTSERGDRLVAGYWSRSWRFRRWLDRSLTFRVTRRLVANSDAGRLAAIRAGCPKDRAVVIANWVDFAEIGRSQAGAADVRREFAPGDACVVGFVGRLAPDKGAEQFVRIARAIAKRCGDRARFVMVGDGPLRARIEADVKACGLARQFVVTGAISNPVTFMHAMDLGVICSPSESLPNVLLEFMACGKPVVAAAVGGLVNAVDDGRTGRLVPANMPDAFADACVALLESEPARRAMGLAARAVAEKHYQKAPAVHEYFNLYEQVARGT